MLGGDTDWASAQTMSTHESLVHLERALGFARPVFQVFSLGTARPFYEQLGFEVRWDDTPAVYADGHGLSIQLLVNPDHDPLSPHTRIYVETEAVDELHAQWRSLDLIPVRTIITPDIRAELRRRWAIDDRLGLISDRVHEQPFGGREFTVRDPDNNEICFGCSAPAAAPDH